MKMIKGLLIGLGLLIGGACLAIAATSTIRFQGPGGEIYTLSFTATGADAESNTTSGLNTWAFLRMFNGTTWDRILGDTTNGLWVNVKNSNANGQATMANSSPVVIASNQSNLSITPYPTGATPYTATATGTTAATTATLAGASSVTTYICGFSIRANATAAATNNATVTGVITATLNFTQWTAPLASGLGITEMIFSPCIPASATNTSIAVVSGAPGSGGTVSVTAWGYKL